MSDDVKLKVDAEPTIFNQEMLIGTLILPVIGTLIGGYIGKNRMEHEKKEGRTVSKDPSFWNSDALTGGLIGSVAGSIGGSLTFAAIAGATLTAVAAAPALVVPATAALALAVAASVELGAIALGTYIGGNMGVSRQKDEYEEAVKQTVVDHISKTVSPEVALTVEQSIAKEKDWAKSVVAQKMLVDAQHGAR